MSKEYFAHTSSHGCEKLIDHLHLTAKLARANGRFFQSADVCEQLGLLHDLGKRTHNFQNVLQGLTCKKDHAIVAAIVYLDMVRKTNTLSSMQKWMLFHMALVMAAHHSVLYTDAKSLSFEFDVSRITDVYGRMTKDAGKEIAVCDMSEYQDIVQYVEKHELLMSFCELSFLPIGRMSRNERMFYIRMLYSCLVDADYSATAEYVKPGYLADYFYQDTFDASLFLDKLDRYHDVIVQKSSESAMNDLRNMVYDACCKKSQLSSGFFTLTAPTGTGKTLALLKFALEHAKLHKKRRIFIILPYLSIIDQNAAIYREILGDDVVLVDNCETNYSDDVRHLAERWSSSIIVTTSVKFFQTLFADNATSVRKLHQVSDSVIVFDECQTLPSDVVNSSLEILSSLTQYYHCSVLFSTATLPAYQYREQHVSYQRQNRSGKIAKAVNMKWQPVEILDDVDSVFAKFEKIKATDIVYDTNQDGWSCEDLLTYFRKESQVLYVFNTVKHAEVMYDAMCRLYPKEECYLLTSRFCSVDKRSLIEQINSRLKKGLPIRLAATQCVEAGVDFDFPCGAREYGPLDSIIQACGRVNRNGIYKNARFLVFLYLQHGKHDYPSLNYKEAADIARRVTQRSAFSFYHLTDVDAYFEKLYGSPNYSHDNDNLVDAMFCDDYHALSDSYHIIEEKLQMVYVVKPLFGDLSEYNMLIRELEEHQFCLSKSMMRRLRKYTVSMYGGKVAGVQLVARVSANETFLLNWCLVDEADYSERGLQLSMDKGGFFV